MNASPLTELTEKEFVKRIGMIVVIIILMLTIYMSLGIWLFNDSKIFPNVFINDINVGGLIPSEAKLRADERLKKQLDEFVIQLAYGDSMWDLDYKDIDLYYLLDNSIENAYRVGRNKGYIHGLKTVFSLRKKPRVIKLEPSYNLTKIVDKIDKISKTIDSPSINAKIIRENEHFIITKEVLGISVDKETLKYSIINAIDSSDVVSIDMDVEDVEPEITENDLKDIGDLIGESVTRFNNYNKSRTENIKIAANVINGTILMPGDEFSFNDSTGPRSAEAGYKEASVIVDGEFTTGIGGGVCQVSTTLYQTALKSDMEITSRRNHGLPVGYVPMGQDATIAYGYIDFKFINNKDFPIYIESFVRGGELHVRIYSKKTDSIYIDLESEILEVIEPKMQIKKDENMYLSERKVGKNGKKGYRVATYKVYLQGGREIKKELISKDYYPSGDGLIIEGTKQEY